VASQGGHVGPYWHDGDCLVDGGASGVPHRKRIRIKGSANEHSWTGIKSLFFISVHSRFCKLCDSDNGHPGRVASEGYGSGHPTLSFNHDKPTRRGVSIMKAGGSLRFTHIFRAVSYLYSVKRYSYSLRASCFEYEYHPADGVRVRKAGTTPVFAVGFVVKRKAGACPAGRVFDVAD
jgi:hypothetical protein